MTFRQLAKLSLEVEATSGREIKPAWVWGQDLRRVGWDAYITVG